MNLAMFLAGAVIFVAVVLVLLALVRRPSGTDSAVRRYVSDFAVCELLLAVAPWLPIGLAFLDATAGTKMVGWQVLRVLGTPYFAFPALALGNSQFGLFLGLLYPATVLGLIQVVAVYSVCAALLAVITYHVRERNRIARGHGHH